MPMVKSKAQAAHLKRLNSLSTVAASRFKSGQPAANRLERTIVPCAACGKAVYKTQPQLARARYHFCSRECHYAGRNAANNATPTVAAQMLEKYQQGMKMREIAALFGVTISTVSTTVYRKRLARPGMSRGKIYVRNHLPQACELCGYARVIELAHVIPVRDGGEFSLGNCLALCPNCHHLYDHDMLEPAERKQLDDIIVRRKEAQNSFNQ